MTAPAAPLRTSRAAGRGRTPLIRVCALNGTNVGVRAALRRAGRAGRSRCLARTTIERPSGVSSARLDSWAASASSGVATPSSGRNSTAWRLPSVMVPVLSSSSVLTSPAASTARPDMASTLRCTSRSMPAMPIADSSAPIVVGIRQTSSATRTIDRLVRAGVGRERLQGHHRQQEDDRQAGQQDVQRDLVRGLLPRRALDQGDHPVDEGLAGLGGDPHDDPVREHLGAAGDRATGRRRTRGSPGRTRR